MSKIDLSKVFMMWIVENQHFPALKDAINGDRSKPEEVERFIFLSKESAYCTAYCWARNDLAIVVENCDSVFVAKANKVLERVEHARLNKQYKKMLKIINNWELATIEDHAPYTLTYVYEAQFMDRLPASNQPPYQGSCGINGKVDFDKAYKAMRY